MVILHKKSPNFLLAAIGKRKGICFKKTLPFLWFQIIMGRVL